MLFVCTLFSVQVSGQSDNDQRPVYKNFSKSAEEEATKEEREKKSAEERKLRRRTIDYVHEENASRKVPKKAHVPEAALGFKPIDRPRHMTREQVMERFELANKQLQRLLYENQGTAQEAAVIEKLRKLLARLETQLSGTEYCNQFILNLEVL